MTLFIYLFIYFYLAFYLFLCMIIYYVCVRFSFVEFYLVVVN